MSSLENVILIALGVALGLLAGKVIRRRSPQRTQRRLAQIDPESTRRDFLPGCLVWVVAPIGMLSFLLFPGRFGFAHVNTSPYLSGVLGITLFTAGGTLYTASTRTLGNNFHGGVGLYEDHTLVTHGPYRLIRNPIYLSYVLFSMGCTLIVQNLYFGFWLVAASAAPLVRMGGEERVLEERFGYVYLEYKARTGRLLPKLRK